MQRITPKVGPKGQAGTRIPPGKGIDAENSATAAARLREQRLHFRKVVRYHVTLGHQMREQRTRIAREQTLYQSTDHGAAHLGFGDAGAIDQLPGRRDALRPRRARRAA